jgi:hypothetical protein
VDDPSERLAMTLHSLGNRPVTSKIGTCGESGLAAPRAYRIPEVCELSGLGRTSIYSAIKAGHLVARKFGRATIVLAQDFETFLRNLPATNGRLSMDNYDGEYSPRRGST